MPDPTAADYCLFAESRLTEAQRKFLEAVALGYEANIIEVAKVASLVWDAAIDLLSALALLGGADVTGISSDMRRYARYNLPHGAYRNWSSLARLHNFQHKPNLPQNEFRSELYYTGVMLETYHSQLPPPMQIAAAGLAWLADAANQPNL